MHIPPETVTEIEYIICHFEERFNQWKGTKIALYPGMYLEEILRNFGSAYRFSILEPECAQVPPGIELVILTDHREGKEPDYNHIRQSCEESGTALMDLFGIDQIEAHREFKAQEYLTISRWKDLLAQYEVISVFIPFAAADYLEDESCWVIRRRFQVLYNWMTDHGKTVVFMWEDKGQYLALEAAGIDTQGHLIERKGEDRGYLQLARQYAGKRILHVGVGTVKDGIVPREYGLDSRLIRHFKFTDQITSAEEHSEYHADKDLLLREIDRHEIISFDIFDTLLKRATLYPEDVFGIVEERTGISGFAEIRYSTQTNFPQLSLDEIYARIKKKCGYDDKTADILRRAELDIERNVILPRRSMIDILDYANDQGKTVILVSDMYLDQGFIREILDKNGIREYDEMYLSYQYKLLKHEGLYEELLKPARRAEKILHIGDNYYSDYRSAREFGLDAFHVPSCLEMAKRNGYERIHDCCRTLADRNLLGLSMAEAYDDPFTNDKDRIIADMVVAPLAMGYLQWVCRILPERNYDYFLLSSRDGWILLDAYERIRNSYPGRLPEGKYFYTSRHAAAMTVPDEADIYREYYRKYLEREGILEKNCAVMDFVSEGRSRKMLENSVTGPMDGYYVGIPEYVSGNTERIQYFFDQELMDFDTEMKIEVYFTSMEPALDHIGEGGRPVFAKEVRDESVLKRISGMHDKVKQLLDKYLDLFYRPEDQIDKDMVYELCASVSNYEVDNYYFDDMSGQEINTRHE